MLTPDIQVPPMFWDDAMSYACVTHSFNFSSAIGTSPYTKVTGQSIDIRWLQPFLASCYVFIPLKDRGKLGQKRAYKAKFVGYANTHLMLPNYFIVLFENGHYAKVTESKDVMCDSTKDFKIYTKDEEPYDREFVTTENYILFLHSKSAPIELKGPQASPHVEEPEKTFPLDFPMRSEILAPLDELSQPIPSENTDDFNINTAHELYDDENGQPKYWYNYCVQNDEYAKTMCETQHFSEIGIERDPRVPKTFRQAAIIPAWKEAIG